MVRIHRVADGPVWFGPKPGAPPGNRFDAPKGEFQILYAAETLTGAFVETVLRSHRRVVAPAFVADRQWTVLETTRPITLARLHGHGLLPHGVDSAIASDSVYAAAQDLALALFEAFSHLDGMAYRSRHNDDEICYAIYDRVSAADLIAAEAHRFEHNMEVASEIIRMHGAAWDTSGPI
jgi:hypothetical protein